MMIYRRPNKTGLFLCQNTTNSERKTKINERKRYRQNSGQNNRKNEN